MNNQLDPNQQQKLNQLMLMAKWFAGYFNRRANDIINPSNDQA